MVTNTLEKKIVFAETGGVNRSAEPVRVGIPFAKGELLGDNGLAILNPRDELQPVQSTILKQWNDGSVKWGLFDFTVEVTASGRSEYRLVKPDVAVPYTPASIKIARSDARWQVNTGAAIFIIDTKEFRPFSSVEISGCKILQTGAAACSLGMTADKKLTPIIESLEVENHGPLRATILIKGVFWPYEGLSPQFFSRVTFFAGSSVVLLEFTLRNPSPARHPGGLWDLGDPGSLFFKELVFEFPLISGGVNEISCSPEPGAAPFHTDNLSDRVSIYQESSGGINWQSPNHRDRNGVVPFKFNGYEMCNGATRVAGGKRAQPVIWSGKGNSGISAVMPKFWQEFPKAMEADGNGLRISLFPACSPDSHELQGGEQKTTSLYLDFNTSAEGLAWARTPLTAVTAAEVYLSSGVIPDLPSLQSCDSDDVDLVDQFVHGPEFLVGNRETTDEFGWRNFGELSADHESVYHQGPEAFISHYNNQYDICAGMYRKFFSTGNPLWGTLAADLAGHILDIDIYHTDLDREEYNGGLFWHTDHYVPAGLSTHRSFSKEHLQVKDRAFCGGGPAAEHCYTSGLLYNYFLTGNTAYREAVIALANWCLLSLGGSQTMLASIRRWTRYIRQLTAVRGEITPAFPRYPLSRGTGNAVVACLDAFEVGGGICFLERAEELLRGAIHPEDDIAARDLLDAENAWSYTVLLVAVSRYIDKKAELTAYDDGYFYARSCLLHYADWMLQHEYPYLDKPEVLEYPNETWPAQDLRKSVIFHHAAKYTAPERRDAFVAKAQYFYTAAQEGLARHTTSCLVRPVALMLQNGWVGARLHEPLTEPLRQKTLQQSSGRPTPLLTVFSVIHRVIDEINRSARNFSLDREICWLKARLQDL